MGTLLFTRPSELRVTCLRVDKNVGKQPRKFAPQVFFLFTCPLLGIIKKGGFVPPFFLGLTPKLAARHGWRRYLLGTLLMARSGRSTRTVRIADRLTLCPSSEYSIMLRGKRRGVRVWGTPGLPGVGEQLTLSDTG